MLTCEFLLTPIDGVLLRTAFVSLRHDQAYEVILGLPGNLGRGIVVNAIGIILPALLSNIIPFEYEFCVFISFLTYFIQPDSHCISMLPSQPITHIKLALQFKKIFRTFIFLKFKIIYYRRSYSLSGVIGVLSVEGTLCQLW